MEAFGSSDIELTTWRTDLRSSSQSGDVKNDIILDIVKVEESVYLTGWKLFLVIGSLWLGTMLVAIDTTIIGVAVPKISTQFDALNDVGWYGSAYLLTVTATQPTFGKFFKFFDPKIVYLCSILLFEAGSTVCAAAPNSPSFILGRAIAGVGAAGLMQGGLNIVALTVPLEKRPLYIGIIVSVFGLAFAFGPPLGGVFTDHVSWRWCFWINLPIGAISGALIAAFLKLLNTSNGDRQLPFTSKLRNLDLSGATLIFGACTCLLLAIQWAGTTYPWNSSRIIGLFVGLGLFSITFITLQWKLSDTATIPYRILKQRSVFMGSLFICCSQATSYVLAYFLPFYFQAVQSISATQSGVRYMALVIPQILALVCSGAIATTTGHYVPYMIGGQSIAVVGLGMLTRITPDSKFLHVAVYLAISGLGIGTAVNLPFTALQVVLSEADLPTGTAIMTFFSQLGGTIAVAIAQSIFVHTLTKALTQKAPSVSPEVVVATGATRLQTLNLETGVLRGVQTSFSSGVANTVIFALALACIAIPFAVLMEWKNVKTEAAKRSEEFATPEVYCRYNGEKAGK